MARVLQEKRDYQRIIHNTRELGILNQKGFTPVLSSNVSAAARRGDDLYIRFWNSSIYKYPNQGDQFERLMAATSKGKWVWRNLRRTNVAYSRVGSLPLDQDVDVSDEELFERVSDIKIQDVQQATIDELNVFNQKAFGVINSLASGDVGLNTALILGGINLM